MHVFTLLGVLFLAGDSTAAEVRLRESAACAAPVVRLADVAEIEAADAALAAALGGIPLCTAPTAGSERTLSQQDVRQLLALSGVERTDVRVSGSQRVTIQADTSRMPMNPAPQSGPTGVRQAAFETQAAKKSPPAQSAQQIEKPVKREQLVERGASVNVYARAAGVRIATSGKALQPGAAGETILVELADNKEKVQARVVAAQAVEVAVPGRNGAAR